MAAAAAGGHRRDFGWPTLLFSGIGKMFQGSDRGAQTRGTGEREGEREENSSCGRGLGNQKRDKLTTTYLDLNSNHESGVQKALHAGEGNRFGSKAIKLSGGAAGELRIGGNSKRDGRAVLPAAWRGSPWSASRLYRSCMSSPGRFRVQNCADRQGMRIGSRQNNQDSWCPTCEPGGGKGSGGGGVPQECGSS